MERIVRVSLMAQVTNYLQNTEAARQKTLQLAAASEDASAKFERQNAAMRDAGVRLTAFGAVALVATGLAVKAAIDWESAWTGVTKTVDGSAQEMAALEEQLRSLTGVLPATHEEIAGVAEAAGQLGVAREDVADFTKTMIDLSETTNLTADEAATSIAQLMNVMQTAPEDVDNLGAALVALGNDGASTERDIVQMAQRIAGAGRIVGLTEAQVLGFANALASVGIEAEAGGSAISRIMTDIAMAVSAGGEDLDRFAAVAGVSAKEFSAAFKKDPADAIATFVEGLARINAEGGDVFATLADLGQSDIRVSQALLGMANSGDLLRKSLRLGSDAWKENTALIEEATKRYGTAEAKIQIASNSIRDAAIDFGSVFLPAVSGVAEAVAGLAQGFTDLSPGVQNLIGFTTVLTGGVSILAGAFLLGVPAVAQFNAQLAILRASEMPGIAAAAAGATTAIGRTGSALAATARFLTGPWGIALAAGAVGVAALQQVVDNLATSTEDFQNIITTGPSASKLLEAGDRSLISVLDQATGSVEDFRASLALLEEGSGNDFLRGLSLPAQQLKSSLEQVGEQLATTAASDLPAAQAAFRALADDMELTDAEQKVLLASMPAFQDALKGVATQQGVVVTSADEAANATKLLNLAIGDAPGVTESAADAYKEAAEEADAFREQIRQLIDVVNEANGLGQDAVTTNARWQSALAGISEEVQRQKDAFEEANGTLEGFSLSLDETTVSGSANAGMLADVAKAAEDAALAQLDLDARTIGADAATKNYLTTISAQRQAFIDSAVEAGFNADEVQKLADKVFALPDAKTVQVIAETAAAVRTIEDFRNRYGTIRGSIVYRATMEGPRGDGSIGGFASGGRVPGPPSYRDNRIAAVASGEFIVKTKQALKYGALLEAINDDRLQGYANGGRVAGYPTGSYVQPTYVPSGPRATPGGSNADLAATIAAAIRDNPSIALSIINPTTRDVQQDAWDAAQTVGGLR